MELIGISISIQNSLLIWRKAFKVLGSGKKIVPLAILLGRNFYYISFTQPFKSAFSLMKVSQF